MSGQVMWQPLGADADNARVSNDVNETPAVRAHHSSMRRSLLCALGLMPSATAPLPLPALLLGADAPPRPLSTGSRLASGATHRMMAPAAMDTRVTANMYQPADVLVLPVVTLIAWETVGDGFCCADGLGETVARQEVATQCACNGRPDARLPLHSP